MDLTTDIVRKVENTARLAIDEAGLDTYVNDLSNILDLVNQMEVIDTNGIDRMAHPLVMTQRLRSDVVREINQRELLQSIKPLVE